jgi:hypothetical protein
MLKLTPAVLILLASLQTSCVVAGYRSGEGGGWFFWPGGLGLLVLALLAFVFLRRRR